MSAPQVLCIIKLGGSAITKKNDFETHKADMIIRAVHLIKKAHQAGLSVTVVHGAGSFGHQVASQYGVNMGYSDKNVEEQNQIKFGFCATRLSVCKLNQLVIAACINAGIPAVTLPVFGLWSTDSGQVVEDGADAVQNILKEGLIPILHGDCVRDKSQGCRILSGDTIIRVLCQKLKPRRVVFLSDVPGIFDRPPDQPEALHLPKIEVTSGGNLSVSVLTNQASHDVTGGVMLKISAATQIVNESDGNIPVFICGIESEAAEMAVLEGRLEGKKGTLITRSS